MPTRTVRSADTQPDNPAESSRIAGSFEFSEARAIIGEARMSDCQIVVRKADRLVVTHGDFSLDNVLIDCSRNSACIDVGGRGVADRYQDLAVCWGDLADYGALAQERFLKRYGISEGERGKLRAFRLLNELF